MSLRTRLLAAFAYGYLLILVALEVPLALNLARRVDAEVRNDAAGQAHIVAAQAAGSMGRESPAPRTGEERGERPRRASDRRRRPGRPARGFGGRHGSLVREPTRDSNGARRPHRAGRAPQPDARRGPAVHRGARDEPGPDRRRRPRHAERGRGQRPCAPERARSGRRSEPRRSPSGSSSRGSSPTRSRARCGKLAADRETRRGRRPRRARRGRAARASSRRWRSHSTT